MSRTLTIARRELRGYVDQPTACVLVVAFLAITLFLAYRTMYASGVASLRPIFDLLPVLFAVFVPAATMRSLAEERRGRTLDWLMAQLGDRKLQPFWSQLYDAADIPLAWDLSASRYSKARNRLRPHPKSR